MAHHRFIIKDDTFAGSHGRGRARQVGEHEERLPPHFWALHRDNVDDPAIRREECEELRPQFLLVYLVIQVFDVQGRVGLGGCHGRRIQPKDDEVQKARFEY